MLACVLRPLAAAAAVEVGVLLQQQPRARAAARTIPRPTCGQLMRAPR
jgi:hypothetical protein